MDDEVIGIISIVGLLIIWFVVMVALKLAGVITFSWLMVCWPLLMIAACIVLVLAWIGIMFLIDFITSLFC